jgi:hypothetical protein
VVERAEAVLLERLIDFEEAGVAQTLEFFDDGHGVDGAAV